MESYLVTLTDVTGTNTSLSGTYNTSQCLPITSDLSPDVCGPFIASVVAVNGVGKSNKTDYIYKINTNVDAQTCFELRGLELNNSDLVNSTPSVLSTLQGTNQFTYNEEQSTTGECTNSHVFTAQLHCKNKIVFLTN